MKMALSKELKNKNVGEVEAKVKEQRKKLKEKTELLMKTWKEQSFLMCNYRMDIAAKEIERWELGLKT